MIKLLVAFGEKVGLPPGVFLAILCVVGAYSTGGSEIYKNIEEFHFLGLYNIAIWSGVYAFLWGVYHFSGYNWFSLNNISQDTSDPKKLNLATMTKQQLIVHAKTLELNLNMKLTKQEIINHINNH
jgi:hypothetical protein